MDKQGGTGSSEKVRESGENRASCSRRFEDNLHYSRGKFSLGTLMGLWDPEIRQCSIFFLFPSPSPSYFPSLPAFHPLFSLLLERIAGRKRETLANGFVSLRLETKSTQWPSWLSSGHDGQIPDDRAEIASSLFSNINGITVFVSEGPAIGV